MITSTLTESHQDARLAVLPAALTMATVLSACGSDEHSSGEPLSALGSESALSANLRDASRFLRQSSWGGSASEIRSLASVGIQSWLNEQFDTPLTGSMTRWLIQKGYNDASVSSNVNGDGGWTQAMWNKLFASKDVLRQRATFALSELFVVSHLGLPISWRNFALANYWTVLETHAFGNFRSLLENVTLSSAMGTYLNMKGNQKYDPKTGRSPDENFAREVMQLFTIGLYELNTDGSLKLDAQGKAIETYDNADIQGLARVFTGWNSPTASDPTAELVPAAYRHGLSLTLNSSLHSPEEKRFLNVVIPAGTDGVSSLKIALDRLFQHANTAPFVAKQMIQRLVTSNPSAAYVSRVASAFNNNGKGVRGDMKALWSAILLDPEARQSASPPNFGKLTEPIVRLLQWGHTFKARSVDDTWSLGYTDTDTALGQMPLRAPSVFNFFRPGYVPPRTQLASQNLLAPEFQILTEPTVVGYINYMAGTVNNARNVKADYGDEKALALDPARLVAHLNLCLAAGNLSDANQTLIAASIASISATTDAGVLNRVYAAILMLMSSTEYLIQR